MITQSKRGLDRFVNSLVLLLIVASTAACGGQYANAPSATSTDGTKPASVPQSNVLPLSSDIRVGGSEATATTGTAMSREVGPTSGGTTDAPAMSGLFGDATTTTGSGSTLRTGSLPSPNYQSSLTAGQVDDNAKFQEYIDYLRRHGSEHAAQLDVSQRLFLKVLDGEQRPVAGARVQLYDGQRLLYEGQTVSDGRVLFFPALADATQVQSLRAVVSRGDVAVEGEVNIAGPEQTVTMSDLKDNTGPVALDLVFLLDATGSMADEIAEIKATVGSIARRIEQLPGSTAPRFGLVAFRDRGDDYVTRSWDFTSDIGQFGSNLSNVAAGGGGDTPESVNAGLYEAINLPGWADNSTGRHLRMIVLVGDAPPHLDYPNDYAYPDLLRQAVGMGIKIFPIGASNLDSGGEYIFRQFAQFTMGQFVFLTYANGVSGEPGPSTTHDVPSDFTVQNLDSLVVRLVQAEVANQTGEQPQGEQVVIPVADTIAKPVEQPVTFLASVQGLSQHVSRELFSWTSLFWLALLAGMLLMAQRIPQRARVAPAATTQADSPEEDIVLEDIEQSAWDERYVPLPTISTTRPPYIDYAAPQLTVPLPSLEAALRDHEELVAARNR